MAATVSGDEKSSSGTEDYLLSLVRHTLRKKLQTTTSSALSSSGSSIVSSSSRTYSTLDESKTSIATTPTPNQTSKPPANKENYYESTSLFSLLPHEKEPKPKQQSAAKYRGGSMGKEPRLPPAPKPPVVQLGPGFEADRERRDSTKWWWVSTSGKPSASMPPQLKVRLWDPVYVR